MAGEVSEVTMPPHAPYDVAVGHEVEIRVYEREEGVLVAECEVGGDTFGGEADIGTSDLQDAVVIDELVNSVARLVYHELLGTPVFREEDEKWVARVAAQAPWEGQMRSPTLGYAAMPRLPEREPEREDEMARSLGDADVSGLQVSAEEMAALTRGEIPESLLKRVLKARSTQNLIETAHDTILELLDGGGLDGDEQVPLRRAAIELGEVRERFEHE